MRNGHLHRRLELFTVDASRRLTAVAAAGVEMPFEVIEQRGGTASLYCYQPLTGEFIRDRMHELTTLDSHAAAVEVLAGLEATDDYLHQHGATQVPADPRGRAEAVLAAFLEQVYRDRGEFGFEPALFEAAYAGLERTLYEGRCTATIIAPLLGVALDAETSELTLGDGLSLVRGDEVSGAPVQAVWGDGDEPHVLLVLSVHQERAARLPVSQARTRFRRVVSALRLFARGGYAIGPMAWGRTDAGAWRPVAIGASGRPRLLTIVPAAREDELRAFYDLVTRRLPGAGELAWALSRFEMGCERLAPFEALTDHLLALRALLEPEGPASGRLAQRLAVICGRPEQHAALAARTARAIDLERAVIAGLAAPDRGLDGLVGELSEHLRAILRDTLCGHLSTDLVGLADEMIGEAADAPVAR
ncbi:MAG TPA: hypothetical protein VFN55_13505 [Solirubrobacteraceae bacterium]|nr:hypothetical protein [Solirubrobacteraceae bacterium]